MINILWLQSFAATALLGLTQAGLEGLFKTNAVSSDWKMKLFRSILSRRVVNTSRRRCSKSVAQAGKNKWKMEEVRWMDPDWQWEQ